MFFSPKVLGTASVILIGLGIVPGLPHVAFLLLGGLSGWLAYELNQQAQQPTVEVQAAAAKPTETTPSVVPLDLMEVQVGYGLIGLVDGDRGGALLDRIKGLRRQIASEMGFVIPPIHIRDNLQLRPNDYAVVLKGVELVRGEVLPGHVLAIDPGTARKGVVQGIPTKEPAFGLPALWISEAAREQAQMVGYTVVDGSSAIATHLSEIIKRHAYELLGRQEVQALLEEVGKVHPKLVEELVPALLPLGAIVRILSNLLREGVPIRDLRTILEAVADHATVSKDTDSLTEAARQALARTITKQYVSPDGVLPVISLDPRLDRALVEQVTANGQGVYWTVDPNVSQRLIGALKSAAERVAARGQQPVILCSPVLRRHIRRLTDRVLSTVPVLAPNEIDGMATIKSAETIRIGDEAA